MSDWQSGDRAGMTFNKAAGEYMLELEAKVTAMEWTEVESAGMPEEEGWYLCAFSDGSVESFYIADDDIAEGGWSSMNISLTHWTANPAHPGGE